MTSSLESAKNILYLIYDGDCILCSNSAQAIKIKNSVGHLEIINARTSHPLVTEALENGFDLNEGILVKYNNQYFYGADAVHFLALIGSPSDTFNKISSSIFKYKWVSYCFYPFFKLIRNIILFLRKIPPIKKPTDKPLIQKIYAEKAVNLPQILLDRYSNRPYSKDRLLLKGEMNITISKTFRLLSPLFRLAGTLAPYPAKKIPVTVELVSNENSDSILMHRIFYYPDRPPYHFSSQVIHVKDNVVIELMRFGFSSKLLYTSDKNMIVMNYGGYVLRLKKWLIPLPLGFLIGKFYAYEEAISDDEFKMEVKMIHPLFGKIFQYDGIFKVAKSHE